MTGEPRCGATTQHGTPCRIPAGVIPCSVHQREAYRKILTLLNTGAVSFCGPCRMFFDPAHHHACARTASMLS